MFLSANKLNLLFQIEIHAQKCIRAVMYAHAVSQTETNMWAFTQNCFAETAIIHWCKIFGSRNEPTHYTIFFNGECVELQDGTRITSDFVRNRFCKSAGISEREYSDIWENIKTGRDKFFVHNEFTESSRPHLPDLDFLKEMALEIRNIIHDIISQSNSEDEEFHRNFRDMVQWNKNNLYLNELQSDCGLFQNAISKTTNSEQRH